MYLYIIKINLTSFSSLYLNVALENVTYVARICDLHKIFIVQNCPRLKVYLVLPNKA